MQGSTTDKRQGAQLPEGIVERRPLERRIWTAQRLAWLVFAGLLVGSLFGLLGGDGPLSRHVVNLPDGEFDLPWLARLSAPVSITVRFPPSETQPVLRIDDHFLDAFSIEQISPPPREVQPVSGLIEHRFPADNTASTRVILRLRTEKAGFTSFRVGTAAGMEPVSILILP